MSEIRLMGSKSMLDQVIPQEVKDFFNLDVKGGDTKIIWNPRDRDEAANAKRTFDEFTAKRFHAFKVDESGSKGEQVDEWDPEIGKMILAPPMAGG